MYRTRALATVVCLVAATVTDADAQPGATPVRAPLPPPPPPPSGPIAGEKSPGIALALSLGGLLACVGLGGMADETGNDNWAAAGGLGLLIVPSLGHWYAGDWWTTGMTIRAAGIGGIFVGGLAMAAQCANDEPGCGEGLGITIFVGATLAILGGGVYDIATAPGAARKHNARLRERAANGWALAPVVTGDRTGFVLNTRF